MGKPKRYLDEAKPFVNNDYDVIYNTDNVNPIYVNPQTGEVKQKDKPAGSIILPEVVAKGTMLKAKEAMDKLPKEKGLENPIIDPFLGIAGGIGGALYKGAQGSLVAGTDLLMPATIDESLVGAGINKIGGKTFRGVRNLLLNSPEATIALPTRATLRLPDLTRKVETNVLPSSGKTIKLGNQEYNDNRAFIAKFNKWNRRYGYPSLSKDLAENSEALDAAIKDRLLQHNTFVRGVLINHKNPNLDILKSKLKSEGIEPTDEKILEALATRYIPEGNNLGGRAGFYDIPDVSNYFNYKNKDVLPFTSTKKLDIVKPDKNYSGAIYASNALDQAKGYARRLGFLPKQGIYKVRRPVDFNGSREDWVLNAEFPFANSAKSNSYYQYELPYLMKYGVSPQKSSFDVDIFNSNMRDWRLNLSNDGSGYFRGPGEMLTILFKANSNDYLSDLAKINFKKGTPFDYYRNEKINNLMRRKLMPKMSDSQAQIFDAFGLEIPQLEGRPFNEVLNEVSKFVNSKRFNDNVYKYYKKKEAEAIERAKHWSISKLSVDDIKDKVIKEGVTPNKRIGNIGTSERLRTTTVNKGNPFQHFIFAGEPYEQGLELVERVPYKDWMDIQRYGTDHRGYWTEGLSRKSKKYGGKIYLDEL